MADTIDLDVLERRIEEEHLRARDALQVLKRYLVGGSNGRVSPIASSNLQDKFENMLLDSADEEPQFIIDKVEKIMQEDPLKRWTVPSMVAHLKQIGFPLAAKKPEATMGLVFAKLANKRKTIRMVKRGGGRNPNLFKAVIPQSEAILESHIQSERAAS